MSTRNTLGTDNGTLSSATIEVDVDQFLKLVYAVNYSTIYPVWWTVQDMKQLIMRSQVTFRIQITEGTKKL